MDFVNLLIQLLKFGLKGITYRPKPSSSLEFQLWLLAEEGLQSKVLRTK
jgi:hypothetical protein